MKGHVLNTKEVKLLSRMASRVTRGNVTTHKDWFDEQCDDIGLNVDDAVKKLANMRLIHRSSRKNFWPVSIMIYKC